MINIEKLQKQSGIIGSSDGIVQVLEMIGQVAPVDISVLILGESGSGKEIMAKAIHKASKRSNQALITVNCGAIPEGIIESELFGHKKEPSQVQVKIEKDILKKPIKVQFF